MLAIYKKEITAFFNDLIGYLVIGLFLTMTGLYLWVFPDTVLSIGKADMFQFFFAGPYVFLLLIPAVTMRSFAEEKKSGMMELLLTRPVTEWQLVLGKYLASFSLVILSLLPTLIYYWTLYELGAPKGNIDSAGVFGSYIGLILLGATYTAIGILASSITNNQIVAFVIAVVFSLFMFDGWGYVSRINEWGEWSFFLNSLGLSYHYNSLSRGVVDSRNVIYFLSLTAFFLTTTRLILNSRKW